MSGNNQGGLVGNLPTGVKLAAIGLLIHMLSKHSGQAAPASEPAASGGGLGGVLGSIFGGHADPAPRRDAAPPAAAPDQGGLGGLLVGPVLGGLGGLLSSLRGHGLGAEADSWVKPGQNQPVAPHQLEKAFAPAELDEAARRAGTDRGTLLDELSRMLPNVVDQATPGGRMPQRESDLGGLLGSLLGGAPRR